MITVPGLETYFGGKGSTGVYQTLINLMPEHEVYVSAFMGADALMRRKKPAATNIGIDLDPKVINYWVNARGHQMESSPPRYWTMSGKINELDLTVIYTDAISYLRSLIGKKNFFGVPDKAVLIFLDPPYLISTKTSDTRYTFHMNDFQHEEMLEIIAKLPYHFLLTCYDNELYKRKLKGWNNKEFFNKDRANKKRTETAYFNYPIPAKLHEYTFVGSNYRKREDLKRKIKRHVAKFLAMPPEERNALLQALNSIDGGAATTGKAAVTSAPVEMRGMHGKEKIVWDFTGIPPVKTIEDIADHSSTPESEKVMNASGSRMWWDRYLKPEFQKIFPFHHHSNFLVNQHGTEIFEPLKCYKCGNTDTGNGSYYTGYMVWFSKDDIRYSCYSCLPEGCMEAGHQEYGYKTPIILPEKFNTSIKHKIVFEHFLTEYIGYAVKKYAGKKITLQELLLISDHIKCNGWGHNWDGNCIEGYNGKLKVEINNDPVYSAASFTMTKSEILQHINDILLLNLPEDTCENAVTGPKENAPGEEEYVFDDYYDPDDTLGKELAKVFKTIGKYKFNEHHICLNPDTAFKYESKHVLIHIEYIYTPRGFAFSHHFNYSHAGSSQGISCKNEKHYSKFSDGYNFHRNGALVFLRRGVTDHKLKYLPGEIKKVVAEFEAFEKSHQAMLHSSIEA